MRALKEGEYNRLWIKNIEEFLQVYKNGSTYYKMPFQIMADLEAEVQAKHIPTKTVMVSYKLDGYILFDFVKYVEKDDYRVLVYEYAGSVS
jgi:hypothetical protein